MHALSQLHPAATCRLTRIGGHGGFRRRLLELGFLPGTPVRVVRRVDIGGLVELELRGCRVTLRTSDAAAIHVEPFDLS